MENSTNSTPQASGSCYDLAKTLPGLWLSLNELDERIIDLDDKRSRESHLARTKFSALQRHIHAVEALIIETPAVTLADVAAQLLMTSHSLAYKNSQDEKAAARATMSSFLAVARAAKIDVREIGFDQMTSFKEKWPNNGLHAYDDVDVDGMVRLTAEWDERRSSNELSQSVGAR